MLVVDLEDTEVRSDCAGKARNNLTDRPIDRTGMRVEWTVKYGYGS
jgi:hypothetical protein